MSEKKKDEAPSPWVKLREPFPPECYGKLYKANRKDASATKASCSICGSYHSTAPGVHLDYVGHAAVTDRLLEVDHAWTWKPMARRPDGGIGWVLDGEARPVGLEIELTVLGVTRPGFGSVEPGAFDAEKQLIGDALRNAAMRFGVATNLWSKAELESEIGNPEAKPVARADKKTGEVRGAPSPKLPARPDPPKAPAKPQAARSDEAGDLAHSVNIDELPPWEPDQNGVVVLWGVPVSAEVFDGWESWCGECPIAPNLQARSKSVLVAHSYASAIKGSVGGKREQALCWQVANAAQRIAANDRQPRNGMPWPDQQKAAAALYQMVSNRLADPDFADARDEHPDGAPW